MKRKKKDKKKIKKEISKKNAHKRHSLEDKAKRWVIKQRIITTSLFVVCILTLMFLVSTIFLLDETFPGFNFGNEKDDKIVLKVNDREITATEFNKQFHYSKIIGSYSSEVTPEEFSDYLIDRLVIIQYADKTGVYVSPEETEKLIDKEKKVIDAALLEESSKYKDYFSLLETEFNITEQEFFAIKEEDIKIEKVLTKLFEEELEEVTDKQIEKYFLENEETFMIPLELTANHVLICHQDSVGCDYNRSVEEALELATKISNETTLESFNTLEDKYKEIEVFTNSSVTEDSVIFDDIFRDVVFDIPMNEVSSPIETSYGFHVVIVTKITEPSKRSLETVSPAIKIYLTNLDRFNVLNDFIDEQKSESEIVSYINSS